VTYSIPGCDHSGWALGRKLRIPFTFNHKYAILYPVKIDSIANRSYEPSEIELLPQLERESTTQELEWALAPTEDDSVPPLELLASVKKQLPQKVYAGFKTPAADRSAHLWSFMCALFRIGFTKEQVFFLAKRNVNNKFKDLRYNADRELAKDILRAQAEIEAKPVDLKALIVDLRKASGVLQSVRKTQIAEVVLGYLSATGNWCHAPDEGIYYTPRDVGRPIAISPRSEYMHVILNQTFGLNRSEAETTFVTGHLQAHAYSLPVHSRIGSLSYYAYDTNTLYLHTGKRDVLAISDKDIRVISNGSDDVIFPWISSMEPFTTNVTPMEDWAEFLFGSCFGNCLTLTKEQGLLLLYVWILFLFFRNDAISRPILALFGQPGCISEYSLIEVKRGEHSARTDTIAQAYNNRWDSSIPTRVLSLKDGVIQWRNVHKIVYSGVKKTYKVCIEGHDEIYATKDHKFLTPDGFVPLSDLYPGAEVIVKGSNNVKNFGKFSGRFATKTARVLSISEHETADTYDIQMEDEPNFLVNGVVVHNSGKSTMFRRIYSFLYGKRKSLNAVTSQDDFDHVTSIEPLVVLDNVNTWERWLPDRLALAAATSEVSKRKLYTDSDSVIMVRQALLGLTAHSPRFGREDVADRLLILGFERLSKFIPEGEILRNILDKRNNIWAQIVLDVQKVLRTPMPRSEEVPQFRIEDFARVGLRIARSINKGDEFHDVIAALLKSQKQFSLDEDAILVSALESRCMKWSGAEYKSTAQIWNELEMVASDPMAFTRMYKNSSFLGRKLWSLQDSLKQLFIIDWKVDKGSRIWRIQRNG